MWTFSSLIGRAIIFPWCKRGGWSCTSSKMSIADVDVLAFENLDRRGRCQTVNQG